jgi:hypothetical protein
MLDGHIFNSKATVFLVPANEHPSHLALRSMTGCFAHPYKATPLSINGANRPLSLRLSALVILQIHTLKGIFLPHHPEFAVQYQFSRTRHPLYFIPYTNQLLRVPLIFFITQPPSPPMHPLSPSLLTLRQRWS